VRRALVEVEKADCVLFVHDPGEGAEPLQLAAQYFTPLPAPGKLLLVASKCDLVAGAAPGLRRHEAADGAVYEEVVLSARSGEGLSALREALKQRMGFEAGEEGVFTARRRHLDALVRARAALVVALGQLLERGAGELVAEDLRVAQEALAEITGEFTPDDLLGRIFSSFCIGK
ncbi:MAG TPA: tRNA uridine-5-carboxymethylaminomethyl(34) synthesis GTPase MnmE, partial [Moraxellaceae bacterium]|nr:tRNA uridine-5-carboxymethylaminomethyl(34) synthesis GTPase MnmE [Moraxellaceae bacterium]